ncbi:hypothetical protein [Rubrivirga litoralis]|uniref:Uncharacterized protein n=1 Tax=Rubrivirga litoralis TaxID=3075598 RepID=A0ABU3BMX7_9BACT|nr:hypothetical protein [Rubrivirga sp. F394]MDT0630631.1 hypothetical protein [Rubrivirga sp. F394]
MTPAPPRPDALAVRALASRAVLPPGAVARLFGKKSVLRGTERVAVVRRGRVLAYVPAAPGADLRLALDALDLDAAPPGPGLRLQGPGGVVDAPAPEPVRSRLVLPDGTRRAWGVPERATVALGPVALTLDVVSGADPHVALDRALWLGAGRPEAARWLPAVDLAPPAPPAADDHVRTVERGVVTETDVRQARLRRQTIRLRPGQIVTPAARSLGHEWGVFAG